MLCGWFSKCNPATQNLHVSNSNPLSVYSEIKLKERAIPHSFGDKRDRVCLDCVLSTFPPNKHLLNEVKKFYSLCMFDDASKVFPTSEIFLARH